MPTALISGRTKHDPRFPHSLPVFLLDHTSSIIATPFYFADNVLFGCVHFPQAKEGSQVAAVLCYPWGFEYLRFHRAFKQLGDRLGACGIPTLRFDYFGTGDSQGEDSEASLRICKQNILAAMEEAKRRFRVQKVALIGLRLGATLAAQAAFGRDDVDSIVLCDPVVHGWEYLDELHKTHQKMLRTSHVVEKYLASDSRKEFLGFAYSDAFCNELQQINLVQLSKQQTNRLLLIQTHPECDQADVGNHLQIRAHHFLLQRVLTPHHWQWKEDFQGLVFPRQLLDKVLPWVVEGNQ